MVSGLKVFKSKEALEWTNCIRCLTIHASTQTEQRIVRVLLICWIKSKRPGKTLDIACQAACGETRSEKDVDLVGVA